MPTQLIPRLKTPSQHSSAQGTVKPGVVARTGAQEVDPAADGVQEVDEEKELNGDQPDGAQSYRRRVEQAELPDDVREAALREVGKLERTNDQSSECSDIRTWLDTILDLPWGTKTTNWIDLQHSREVEATLLGLIKPAAADIADDELAAADPKQVHTDQIDTLTTDRQDADTTELPPVVAVVSGDPQPVPQPPRQQSVNQAAADAAEDELAPTDPEPADLVQVEVEQVEAEQVDTTPAGPHDGDTVELPTFVASSGDGGLVPQLRESQEKVQPAAAHIEKVQTPIANPADADTKNTGAEAADAQKTETADVDAPSDIEPDTENDAIPRAETEKADTEKAETVTAVAEPMAASSATPRPIVRPRRVRRGVVVAAVLLLLGCAVAVYQIVPGLLADGSRPSATASSALTPVTTTGAAVPSAGSSPTSGPKNGSAQGEAIRLDSVPESGRTFEAVRIRGTYPAAADTFLRVQHWEGGKWADFPVPAKADDAGKFTAHVEFWQPGRYEVRVRHPNSGAVSKTFVLVIKG